MDAQNCGSLIWQSMSTISFALDFSMVSISWPLPKIKRGCMRRATEWIFQIANCEKSIIQISQSIKIKPWINKPAILEESEILRMLHVLFSIDLIDTISSLPVYWNSELIKESLVDMLSSSDAEPLKELLGEMSIHLGAQTTLLNSGQTAPSLLGAMEAWTPPVLVLLALVEHASLGSTSLLDFTLDEACKVFLQGLTFFCELATESFLVFAVFDAHGTFN